jgi:hypothetical protein
MRSELEQKSANSKMFQYPSCQFAPHRLLALRKLSVSTLVQRSFRISGCSSFPIFPAVRSFWLFYCPVAPANNALLLNETPIDFVWLRWNKSMFFLKQNCMIKSIKKVALRGPRSPPNIRQIPAPLRFHSTNMYVNVHLGGVFLLQKSW